jgi:hypothetical protein
MQLQIVNDNAYISIPSFATRPVHIWLLYCVPQTFLMRDLGKHASIAYVLVFVSAIIVAWRNKKDKNLASSFLIHMVKIRLDMSYVLKGEAVACYLAYQMNKKCTYKQSCGGKN